MVELEKGSGRDWILDVEQDDLSGERDDLWDQSGLRTENRADPARQNEHVSSLARKASCRSDSREVDGVDRRQVDGDVAAGHRPRYALLVELDTCRKSDRAYLSILRFPSELGWQRRTHFVRDHSRRRGVL